MPASGHNSWCFTIDIQRKFLVFQYPNRPVIGPDRQDGWMESAALLDNQAACRHRPGRSDAQRALFGRSLLLVNHDAVADRHADASKSCHILGRIGVEDRDIPHFPIGNGAFFVCHSKALCRSRGQHAQHILHVQAALLQCEKLIFRPVARHITDVGAEHQRAAKFMKLPHLGVDR